MEEEDPYLEAEEAVPLVVVASPLVAEVDSYQAEEAVDPLVEEVSP